MTRDKQWARTLRFVLMTLAFLSLEVVSSGQQRQTLLPKLDAPLKWEYAEDSNVLRAANSKHVYFVLPWSLELVVDEYGVPMFFLSHHGVTCNDERGTGGRLTATIRPIFGSYKVFKTASVEDVREALLARDPQAVVTVPTATSVEWSALISSTSGSGSFASGPKAVDNSLSSDRQLQAELTLFGVRTFLVPSDADQFGARLRFTLLGKIKNRERSTEKEFIVGQSFSLSCRKYPSAFKDLTLGGTGCLVFQSDPKPKWLGGDACGRTEYPAVPSQSPNSSPPKERP